MPNWPRVFALMAELTEIPAGILHVSDETAAEMAVTENLQRKDVTPIEEANAYQKLMESGRYDVQSLAVQFGKNENYIRTRLKFVSLIPEIAELLEKDEITISVASEICRYGTDIQKEVYGISPQTLAVTHSTRPYAPHAPTIPTT